MVYSVQNKSDAKRPDYIDNPELALSVLSAPACVADNVNTGFVKVSSKKDDFMYFAGMSFFGEQFASLWVWLAERDLANGKEAIAEGKKGEAIKYFEDAVKKFHAANIKVGELSTQRLLADAYFAAGQMDQAYNTYLSLVKEARSGRWAIPAEEMGFLNIGLVSAAEIHLDQQMNFKTYEAGQAVEAGQFEKAESLFKEALEIREAARGYGINTDYFIGAEKSVELKDLVEKLNGLQEAAPGTPKGGGSLFKHGLLAMAYDVLDLEHRRVEYALYARDLLDAAERFEGKLPQQVRGLLERARFALRQAQGTAINKCTKVKEYAELDSRFLKIGNRNVAQLNQMTASGVALQLLVDKPGARPSRNLTDTIKMLRNGQLVDTMKLLMQVNMDYIMQGREADRIAVMVIWADLAMTLRDASFASQAAPVYADAVEFYERSGDEKNLRRAQKKLERAREKRDMIVMQRMKCKRGEKANGTVAYESGDRSEAMRALGEENGRDSPEERAAEEVRAEAMEKVRDGVKRAAERVERERKPK